MKKHHILLILLVTGIAAYFLNESRVLKSTESRTLTELAMLRDAVKKSSGSNGSSLSNSRRPVIDPQALLTDLSAILKNGPDDDFEERIKELAEKYEKQLASAPLSKLREICELLEKDFSLNQKEAKPAGQLWFQVVAIAAKSDPAWAFEKLEQASSEAKASITDVLSSFKTWASQDGEPMSLSYSLALQNWLDAAQADGRIDPNHPLVMELRAEVATAQGNLSTATQQISQLSFKNQSKAAKNHLKGLQTPAAQRQAIEELSTALHPQNFPSVMADFATEQGVAAAREILSSASLTPESHDLAAAGIAAAKIGPDTKEAAAWLLDSLRSDDHRALATFMSTWTHGDHTAAASWVDSLPKGPRRDAALRGFVPAAATVDGATAIDWALTISDPLTRNMMYSEAHAKWRQIDPAQADAYQKSNPLDADAVSAASQPQSPSK